MSKPAKRDLLFAALGKLVTASPEAIDPHDFERAPFTIRKDQAFVLEWKAEAPNGSMTPVFRIGIKAEEDAVLAPYGFCVWWWHEKFHPLPHATSGWNDRLLYHDHHPDPLWLNSEWMLTQFRIMASVMEKLPELERLFNV